MMASLRMAIFYFGLSSAFKIGLGEQGDYFIHHHCYQEGGSCSPKKITCDNNTVIDIIWSRVGYSQYWELDGTRTNCSVTNETCYEEIDEPRRNCSGLTECSLDTCSNSTSQVIDCTFPYSTNYMQINYTCVEDSRTTVSKVTWPTVSDDVIGSTETSLHPSTDADQGDEEDIMIIIVTFSVIAGAFVITGVGAVLIVTIRQRKMTKRNRGKEVSNDGESQRDYAELATVDNKQMYNSQLACFGNGRYTEVMLGGRSPQYGSSTSAPYTGTELLGNGAISKADNNTPRPVINGSHQYQNIGEAMKFERHHQPKRVPRTNTIVPSPGRRASKYATSWRQIKQQFLDQIQ